MTEKEFWVFLNGLKVYNKAPDKELCFLAQFALDECEMWNE